jgi:multicomponent Na+:H+ antiporter subunit E
VLAWERRVVQAFGSRAQVKTVTDAAAGGAS